MSSEEVYSVSSELYKGKFPGKDGVSAKFFKYGPVCHLEFVTMFFTNCTHLPFGVLNFMFPVCANLEVGQKYF